MILSNIQFIKYLFISALLLSNIMASKIVSIGVLILPASVVVYPLTFLLTDVVSEVEGKKSAHTLVIMGFYMSLFMVLILFVGKILTPAPFWKYQDSYNVILGATPRIVLASMIAYIISQNHDVWAFHWWKRRTAGRRLWVRNNLSTMASQLIDSVLFIGIAFSGVYSVKTVGGMILGQYLVKIGIAILDTPFCYLLVRFYAKDRERKQRA